jgi:arsenite methyltransferase
MTIDSTSPAPEDEVRAQVRERYGRIASGEGCCSSSDSQGCCGDSSGPPCCGDSPGTIALGYKLEDLSALPEGANLGLGCGNPTALASLNPGETVVDLGSGAGIDCFLAANRVGPAGHVIGVDMTPEMLTKARANAGRGVYPNVEFRLGEIEHLPIADSSVDVILSNCVINLAPDKGAVYREAFRVLRPGGRLAVSDVVATAPISPERRHDLSLWSSCSSGALEVPRIEQLLTSAGFSHIEIALGVSDRSNASLRSQREIGVVPADIRAFKPIL